MKPRILILDFDGVLNSYQHFVRAFRLHLGEGYTDALDQRRDAEICPVAFSNFLWITESVPFLQIVLSTSWRLKYTLDDLHTMLKQLGLKDAQVVGKTPRLEKGRTRSDEIKAWLKENPECDYVILEDGFIDHTELHDGLVQTDPRIGLTCIDALEAIETFIPDFIPPEIPNIGPL